MRFNHGYRWPPALAAASCVVLLVVAATASDRPRAVGVGDEVVDGSSIKPYANLWKVSVRRPDGTVLELGTWSDEMTRVDVGGRAALRRVQVAKLKGHTSSTTNVFDARTLEPISDDLRGDDGRFAHREFAGASVKVERLGESPGAAAPTAAPTATTATLGRRVFDFYGGMYGLLLAGFPLREGYSATFPSILEYSEEVVDVTFRVDRKEPVVAGPGKTVVAWVVVCDTAQGAMTFWLTKREPYVIRLVFADAKGNVWSYDMA